MEFILQTDQILFQAVNLVDHPAWLDFFMLALSSHLLWIAVAVFILVAAVWRRDVKIINCMLFIAISVGISDLTSFQLLKPAFSRARPCHQDIEYRLVQASCGGDWGFPSNHAANSGAVVAAIAIHLRKKWVTVCSAILALGISISRVYLGVHFPGDVVAGLLVGICCGVLPLFFEKSLKNIYAKKFKALQ